MSSTLSLAFLGSFSFVSISKYFPCLIRQGKYFEIDTKENDPKKAKDKVEDMCKKLLANLVIENYKIIDAQ